MAAGSAFAGLLIPLADGPLWLVLLLLAANQLFADGFAVAYMIPSASLWQTVLPLSVLGRARAAIQAMQGALMPLGALAGGFLGTVWDVRSAVWVGVTGALLSIPVLYWSPLRGLKSMPAPHGETARGAHQTGH